MLPARVKDALVVFGLVSSLSTAVTAWLATAYGLVFRPPRWRAPVALLCPPLAAVWAFREGMALRGLGLVAGTVVYGVMYVLASR